MGDLMTVPFLILLRIKPKKIGMEFIGMTKKVFKCSCVGSTCLMSKDSVYRNTFLHLYAVFKKIIIIAFSSKPAFCTHECRS